MRSTAAIVLLLAIALSAIAKDPEPSSTSRSRSRDVLDPDDTKTLSFEQLQRGGVSAPTFRTGTAGVNSFYFQQKFQPTGYETKGFRSKGFWGGDFKFATKDARTKTYDTKAVPVKDATVKEARDMTKTATTRGYADAGKQAQPKGRSQALLDKEGPAAVNKVGGQSWSGNLEPLTVQDIKELLNKNK